MPHFMPWTAKYTAHKKLKFYEYIQPYACAFQTNNLLHLFLVANSMLSIHIVKTTCTSEVELLQFPGLPHLHGLARMSKQERFGLDTSCGGRCCLHARLGCTDHE